MLLNYTLDEILRILRRMAEVEWKDETVIALGKRYCDPQMVILSER